MVYAYACKLFFRSRHTHTHGKLKNMPLSKEITENRLRRTCGAVQPTIQFYLCIIMHTKEHENFFSPYSTNSKNSNSNYKVCIFENQICTFLWCTHKLYSRIDITSYKSTHKSYRYKSWKVWLLQNKISICLF